MNDSAKLTQFPTVPVIAVPTTYNHVTEDELQARLFFLELSGSVVVHGICQKVVSKVRCELLAA